MAPNKMLPRERAVRFFHLIGFPVFEPVVRLVARDQPAKQIKLITQYIGVPILCFCLFLILWSAVARTIRTNYGTVPTPSDTWHGLQTLTQNYYDEQDRAENYYAQRKTQAAALIAQAERLEITAVSGSRESRKAAALRAKAERQLSQKYMGPPTYPQQILTSLRTVFTGFAIASVIAIPIGIICGLSKIAMAALNPLIQIFKPVSPLAWLPIVAIVVGALHPMEWDQYVSKAFINSAVTVALCSLWPTLMNTALGVASIDKDYLNVAKVLKLSAMQRLFKIILPASLPLMFAGLRISLGVGWMVLIAAEMLAQNPGLGKFVWDMYTNGNAQTMSLIFVAVFTIGLIGFMLDRIMIVLQRMVSFDAVVSA